MFQRAKLTLLISALCISLTGCPAILLGGAATGAKVGFDRRSSGAQADDNVIDLKTESTINQKIDERRPAGSNKSSVKVVTYNRGSLLMGVVLNEEESLMAERIVRAQPSVRKVYNHLTLANNSRSFGDTSRDTWITSKIRTNLLGAKGFAPNHIKVVTYNGTTYAMGILRPDEQAAATKIIRETSGVQKVITLFETFTE